MTGCWVLARRAYSSVVAEKEGASSAHHLGDVERRAFVATLLSVVHTAQYSKNAELVYSAEQSLKHLACA